MPTTLDVIKRLVQWWCRRGTKTACFAALTAIVVFGINALYLPVHLIMDHHGHGALSGHEHHSAEHKHHVDAHVYGNADCLDQSSLERIPSDDGDPHYLPSSRMMAPVVAVVALSLQVTFLLPPPRVPEAWIDTKWHPTCIDSDRAPPGLSRAPPV